MFPAISLRILLEDLAGITLKMMSSISSEIVDLVFFFGFLFHRNMAFLSSTKCSLFLSYWRVFFAFHCTNLYSVKQPQGFIMHLGIIKKISHPKQELNPSPLNTLNTLIHRLIWDWSNLVWESFYADDLESSSTSERLTKMWTLLLKGKLSVGSRTN